MTYLQSYSTAFLETAFVAWKFQSSRINIIIIIITIIIIIIIVFVIVIVIVIVIKAI